MTLILDNMNAENAPHPERGGLTHKLEKRVENENVKNQI